MLDKLLKLYNLSLNDYSIFETFCTDLINNLSTLNDDYPLLNQLNRTLVNFVVNNTSKKFLIILLDSFTLTDEIYYSMALQCKINFILLCKDVINLYCNNILFTSKYQFRHSKLTTLNDFLIIYFNNIVNYSAVGEITFVRLCNEFLIYSQPYQDAFDQYQLGINLLSKIIDDKSFSLDYFNLKIIYNEIIQHDDIKLLDETLIKLKNEYDIELMDNRTTSKYKTVLITGIIITSIACVFKKLLI